MKTAAAGGFEILCYHRVGLESSLDGLTISKKIFTQQMRFIRQHCRPMALTDLVRALRERKKIPSCAVAVTFDDGYLDTFKRALPILKKFKIPAVVFVTTGFVDRKVPMHQKAVPLTWKMILKMQREGIEIGCHTLTHPKLTRCSLREIDRQITASRKRLEEILHKPARLFAYPYGGPHSFNKQIQSRVRKAGFWAAVTTLPGSNNAKTSLYALHRMAPLENQIHSAIGKWVHEARKKNPKIKLKISGVPSGSMRMWSARESPAKKKLPGNPFYWRIGRPADV